MQEMSRFERTRRAPDNRILEHFIAIGMRSHYAERFRMWEYDPPARLYEPAGG